MDYKTTTSQAMRFATTGVLNTIIDFLIFSGLVFIFEFHIISANFLAFLVAVSFSYVINKKWTFSGQTSGHGVVGEWARFVVVSGGGFLLATLVLYLCVPAFPVLIAKIIATGVSFCWNFMLSRLYIWKN